MEHLYIFYVLELIWADMKSYIRSKRAKTMYDLIKSIREYERKFTPEFCKRYSDKLHVVIKYFKKITVN